LKALEGSGDVNAEKRRQEVLSALRNRMVSADATATSLTPAERALLDEIRQQLK
jgi:hypothetical protein